MPVGPNAFTRALAQVPGPVAVITTIDDDGRRWGFTGSAFCSVSLDPPLVLVCLARTASTHAAFQRSGRYLVNVLGEHQTDVALRFAKSGSDRFSADDTVSCELGLPGLLTASARLACTIHQLVDAGDHTILIGLVQEAYSADHVPLTYWNRAFGRPAGLG
ncbi:flavin reductase family protein [Umezawaea sp. Da 62-37]|uniref:flavin reductase family protein n=1 Tax=Umezawaea sp. Da 62-37 TaxID=3075927 RepID=UPI0028F6C714|nr:flavin reductase family protein [Umezawaea sp. Da 62-37]WNV87623.1 flavin reductase family protein [Umezawaea sp. Da 62-37]